MAFHNFIVSGGAKEVSFIPRDPKDFSYGVGSPSISVNNNDVDAPMVEPIAITEPSMLMNTEKTPLIVENIVDSDDLPSNSDQVIIVGSSGIADMVRDRKGISAKALKMIPKRKLDIPTLLGITLTVTTVKHGRRHS